MFLPASQELSTSSRSASSRSGFSLFEVLIAVVLIGVVGAVALSSVGNLSDNTRNLKLESDLGSLNRAVSNYLAFGGSLEGVEDPGQVLAKLKTVASDAVGYRMPGTSGSVIDSRTRFRYQSQDEAGSGQKRIVWNAASQRFEIATSGQGGVAAVELGDAGENEAPVQEERDVSVKYAQQDSWIWDFQDRVVATNTAGATNVAVQNVTPNPLPTGTAVPPPPAPSPTPPSSLSSLVALPDTLVIGENSGGSFNLLANDSQSNGDPFRMTQFLGWAVSGQTVTLPSGLILTISPDGTVTFDPSTAYDSLDDGEDNTVMFSYQIVDNDGNSATSIVSLKIEGEDDPMYDTAASLVYSVNATDTLTIDGLYGIVDPDDSDNPLSLVSATSASGALAFSSDGNITYTAPALASSSGTNYGFRGTGKLTLSVDGIGVGANAALDSGFIQVEKPAGATVEAVYMLAMGDVASDYDPSSSPVRIAGVVPVLAAEAADYDASGFSSAHTQFGDVTSSLAATLNSLPAGTSDLLVEELETLEGVNLFVVWNDPSAPITSAAIWMGSQNTLNGASGSLLFDPIDTSSPDFEVTMGIGIGYSYNDPATAAPEQVSRFRVNGSQIDNRAGGYDDGIDFNGGLWTIGGLGDDPYATDDELYDVTSYIDDGDTTIDWTADSVTGHDVDWINSVYAQARGASFAASANDLITLVIQNQDGDQITVTRQVAIR